MKWELANRIEHAFAWLCQEMKMNGVGFDKEGAEKLVEYMNQEMDRLYSEVEPHLKKEVEARWCTTKPFKTDGSYTQKVLELFPELEEKNGRTGTERSKQCGGVFAGPSAIHDSNQCFSDEAGPSEQHSNMVHPHIVVGPYDRVGFRSPDLGSRVKLIEQLKAFGWEPTEYTPVTEKGGGNNPKLTDDSLEKLGGIGRQIALWWQIRHKKSQIEGWLPYVRGDGRIGAEVIPCSTNTARVSHKVVANIPKANYGIYYPHNNPIFGTEIRELFCAPPGRVMVGCDVSGLEARILAHYMQDDWFTNEILEGDIHTKTWEGCQDWVDSRSTMKNCFYAYVFGAGYYRLGITAGYSPEEAYKAGQSIDKGIRNAIPSLADLNDKVKKASRRGYIKGLDGRPIWMRKDKEGKIMEHKALNTLIQSAGSIAVKVANCYASMWIKKKELDALQVIYMHDELIFDSSREDAERTGKFVSRSIEKAGEFFELRCPLVGEYNVGRTWADVH